MKLFYKITGGIVVIVVIALTSLALVLGYTSPCDPAPSLANIANPMKAIVYRCYGSPDVLEFRDVEKPTPKDDEILVKVHVASVNPLDWHYMRGEPHIMRMEAGIGAPKDSRVGVDFAGTVEAIGSKVTQFKVGDEVFGGKTGAFAEYLTIRESRSVVPKPTNVSFEQAASVPIAALTALQALRDRGQLQPGQTVLINGASGGVGTFAVQIAKTIGAEVTGVCSTRNVDLVRSIGADHVIDYTYEDFTQSDKQYDLVIDNVGNHSLLDIRKVLKPDGIYVIIGGSKGRWLGPMMGPIKALMLSPFVDQKMGMMLATMNKEDLTDVSELMQSGKVTAIIDSRYALSEVPAAIRHSEDGHARGKIVIDMD